jgi:membrane-associated phospholipid phosphatase
MEVIWIHFSSLEFYYSIEKFLVIFFGLLFFYLLYLFYKRVRPDPKIMTALLSVLTFLSYTLVVGLLSYLTCTLNLPLIDSTLATIDGDMGFSSLNLVLMFRQHMWLYIFFGITYDVFLILPCFILLYFVFLGNPLYFQRFLMQYIIASFLTVLIAGFLPAAGPYVWYHYTPTPELQGALDRFYELRNHIVDIRQGNGVVTLPSFHTIASCLYIYAFRHEKKIIFIPILILNLLIIFSCLPIGQHYLADILAGIVVFGATVAIEQLIFWSVQKHGEPLGSPFQKNNMPKHAVQNTKGLSS